MSRTRMLGVVVANGFASEAKVFASLLAARDDRYDVLVLHHTMARPHPKDAGALERFTEAANAPCVGFDAGWVRQDEVALPRPQKALAWLKFQRALVSLLRKAHEYRPTLVYSSQQRWDCYAASMLATILRVPQVIHLHYRVEPVLGKLVLARLRQVDGVVCISDYIAEQAVAHGVARDRARTVHNSLALTDAAPVTRERARSTVELDDDAVVFVIAARLEREKGQLDTVRAFARIVPELPKARLLIAGDGSLRQELESLVQSLGLSDSVRILGHRRDVAVLLRAADIFVHPSLAEPFGLSILEASAASLPTIAYRDAGPTEIIVGDETGMLVAPGDVTGLARAMLTLANDSALARRMGARARDELALRFDPKSIAPRFADFLAEVSFGPRARVRA